MASSTQTQINIDVNVNASSGRGAESEMDFSFYLPLYRATLSGNWDAASQFFDQHPDALKARIAPTLETALHIAVAKTSRSGLHFVEKLIERMPSEALALTSSRDGTALATAARLGNVEAAKLLVRKNPELPLMRDSSNAVPLHRAAQFGHRQMLVYLLEVTRDDVEPSPFVGESGVLIIRHVIFAEFYDLALKLVQRYPALATYDDNVTISPLATMAIMPSAFSSGRNLKGWERFIYTWIPIPIQGCLSRLFKGATVSYQANDSRGQRQIGNLHLIVTEKCITLVLKIMDIYDREIKHHQSLQLVKFLCKEAASVDYKRAESIMRRPLFDAVSHGIREIVEEIVAAFPPAVWWSSNDGKCHNIFQKSILHRRSAIFSLLYQTDQPTSLIGSRDRFNNNTLHLAGELAPSDQLNRFSGAALQMQWELRWFKEVEKFVPPAFKEEVNSEMKTPAMVFTEAHNDLLIKAEKWMKDTASSYSLVAALIATVMFAAAITMPGGSNNATGFPVFRAKMAFKVFAISDALSLLFAIVSIVVFLSIWTAPCAESDFLDALPMRFAIGHATLYYSIVFMMVAFSATLYLFSGHNKAWVLALVVAYGLIPVVSFVHMTMLIHVPSNFRKQSNRPFY